MAIIKTEKHRSNREREENMKIPFSPPDITEKEIESVAEAIRN